jgi:tetratricopeptide (TPR) repeat protein
MRYWISRRPADWLKIVSALLILGGIVTSAVAKMGDTPAGAKGKPALARLAPGSEVVLKAPELPLFDEGNAISAEDHLTFTVERSESGRLLLVTRDNGIRGWVYPEEVVPLEQATSYFDQVVLADKQCLDAYWVLGRLWLYQNDNDRALVDFRRAIGRFSDQSRYYLSRSLVYLRKRQIDRALADCEMVLRLDPDSVKGRLVREKAELARKDYQGAMAALEQVFRSCPTNPFPRGGGPAPKAQGDEPPSIGGLDANSDGNPTEARPVPQTAAEYLASGESWYDKAEYDKAIKDYNAALAIEPRYAPAYASRARAWVKKHYRERELADYDMAISIEPQNATYRLARAESWSARGRNALAMADYAEAIRLDPANPSIWVSRGNEWRKDHKIDQAIADFTQAIQLNPRYMPAYIARANVWKQIRRFDRAIQEFSDLIRLDPQDPVPRQTLARMLATSHEDQYRNGRWALEEATRACELSHWIDPDAYDTLAAACAETGDFASAVRWQNLAIKLVRQRFPSALQKKAVSMGGGRGAGVGFEDRLAFYKSKKPIRE